MPLSAVATCALLAQYICEYIALAWRLGSGIDAVQMSCSCSCLLALSELLLQSVSVEVSGSVGGIGCFTLDTLDTLNTLRHLTLRHRLTHHNHLPCQSALQHRLDTVDTHRHGRHSSVNRHHIDTTSTPHRHRIDTASTRSTLPTL